jgi:uncharacterized protein YdhG (YjbR/CyaY superfamily)
MSPDFEREIRWWNAKAPEEGRDTLDQAINMRKDPWVTTYLEQLPAERRDALEQLRSLVFKVAPHVVESVKYGMPYYEAGRSLCAFASQKRYLSLYIFDKEIVARYRHHLQDLDVGVGCIRFRRIAQLPLDVIEAMLRDAYGNARAIEE